MKEYKTKNNCGEYNIKISKFGEDLRVETSMACEGSCFKHYSAGDRITYFLAYSDKKEVISNFKKSECFKGPENCQKLTATIVEEYLKENEKYQV